LRRKTERIVVPYHIVVVVREVWDTRDIIGGALTEGGALKALPRRLEPEDLNSLEQALQIKDREGGRVTALSLAPAGDLDVLRECLYRGADEAVRVVPPAGPLDSAASAALLAAAIRRLGEHSLILLGVSVPEGENSLLAGELAGRLGHAQVSYVDSLAELTEQSVLCRREIEMGSEFVRVPLPAVLALGVYLLKDDPRTPRSAKAMLKLKLKKAPIPEWSAAELGLGDGSGLARVRLAGLTALPMRQVETREVDPEDEAALRAMLQEIRS
jgi:electron transfer flavoprotein beta subunit